MASTHTDASDLVMTQAELPPGIDAPSPRAERDRIAAGEGEAPDVENELYRLADRVGGWDRLRTVIDRLAATSQ
jgi:hypothetical protein